jgi:hyperosmotically inducible protein
MNKNYLKVQLSLSAVVLLLLMGCNKPSEVLHVLIPTSSKSSSVPDSEVSQKVQIAFLSIPGFEAFDIDVVSRKGDVRISGVVDSQSQIDAALKFAREIDGAHTINNQLTVKQ